MVQGSVERVTDLLRIWTELIIKSHFSVVVDYSKDSNNQELRFESALRNQTEFLEFNFRNGQII